MLSSARILAESIHPFRRTGNFPYGDWMIFSTSSCSPWNVTIRTQVFEEDVCQINKLWFHKKSQHASYWWNTAQDNKRLTRVRKTCIYINMQRHLLQSGVTCWFKPSAGEALSVTIACSSRCYFRQQELLERFSMNKDDLSTCQEETYGKSKHPAHAYGLSFVARGQSPVRASAAKAVCDHSRVWCGWHSCKVYVWGVLRSFKTKLLKSDSQTGVNHQDLMENVQNKFII